MHHYNDGNRHAFDIYVDFLGWSVSLTHMEEVGFMTCTAGGDQGILASHMSSIFIYSL